MAYDLPPVVLSSEVQHLTLPCGPAIWEASSEQAWKHAVHRSKDTSVSLFHALRYLLGCPAETEAAALRFTAIGSFVVLQALIQHIFFVRQLHRTSNMTLPPAELQSLQEALRRWKTVCQRTPISSLDPRNADGPVPFASAAFLASAFARLHIDLGPCRQLHTRNPKQIAEALLSTPVPECTPEAIPALLHAAHFLSVPVEMGVNHIAGSQAMFGSWEHAVCGLESGIFLWRWLQSAGESLDWTDLDPDEKGIVSWVHFSISETLQSVSPSELGLADDTVISTLSFPKLGTLLMKIWAKILSSNTTFAVACEIGTSLKLLIEKVEAT